MGLRQREWAARRRQFLMEILGCQCVKCKAKGTKRNPLTFDCIIPMGDRHHRVDQSVRISFYMRQARENNLQVLCSQCQTKKSNTTDRAYYEKNPF